MKSLQDTASHSSCFHCGDRVPAGTAYAVQTPNGPRPVCCAGCEAVAATILGQGLDAFYRLRGENALGKPPDAPPEDLALYDHPEVQRSFVRTLGDEREAVLLLEGIRCPACVWLNEQILSRVPGVVSAQVNYATRRATVRWNPRSVRLSDILAAVRRVGYGASPYDPARVDMLQRQERRDALWRLFVAGFGMMQVMMYALPAYIAADGEISADIAQLMRWASFALTLPVVVYAAAPFFRGAMRDLGSHRLGMDVTVALGVGIAFGASVIGTLLRSDEVYFDSVTMFVFLLLAGRYLEIVARQRAASSLQHLGRLAPEFAHRLRDFPGSRESERVPAVTLLRGELVVVKPGETVPADGVVLEGRGEVSEALLSGEAHPRPKQPGSEVIGGSINMGTPLVVRVEKVAAESVLSAIARLVERAAGDKPRLVAVADRWVSPFLLSVVVLALLAALGWATVDPGRGLMAAVAVLVATCPCAFSLAMPTALTVATAELAKRGVVPTRGHAVESLARATDIVFDKTGTLTRGELSLTAVACHANEPPDRCLAIAAALEAASEHPIGKAFAAAAGTPLPTVSDIEIVPGAGVQASLDGVRYRIGRFHFVNELAGTAERPTSSALETVVWLAHEGALLASFQLADELRAEADEIVKALQALGLRVHLLSGDGREVAQAVATRLGIIDVEGEATPDRKRAYAQALQQQGRVVAMVGDGINDAPVLAQANVSLAMGSGTRLAQTEADAVVLASRLAALPQALRLARRTLNVVRQNVAWAFVYNLTALPLALSGLLTPWAAALGMSLSSLLVVVNALRLQRGSDRPGALRAPATKTGLALPSLASEKTR